MNAAVIVAGGEGVRFGAAGGKQLALVEGLPVLGHTVRAFEECALTGAVVVVCHPDRVAEHRELVGRLEVRKVHAIVPGGATRRASVLAGLRALPDDAVTVSIHDGARPLVTPNVIAAAIRELESRTDVDGVVVGHPSYDTIKVVDEGGLILETPDRSRLWAAQTPQTFRTRAILGAHEIAERDEFEGTDDASLVERVGGRVALILGPRENIKVTVAEDLAYVASVLRQRRESEES